MTSNSSRVSAVVGLQWGDEGKGKVVDYHARDFDVVVRYQGGANAGHTVEVQGESVVLHHLPSSMFQSSATGVLARGMVIHPETLVREIDNLQQKGRFSEDQFKISPHCHVVLPYHRQLDGLYEEARGNDKVETTRKGIGPCHGDKTSYWGIQMKDLLHETRFREKVEKCFSWKSRLIEDVFQESPLEPEKFVPSYLEYGQRLSRYMTDTTNYLQECLEEDRNILMEGAQGTLLDVDMGSYPYVTASNPFVGGVCSGTGVPPASLTDVEGVAKAYSTRVGGGPLPTEMEGTLLQKLREKGDEFGSTTGRPRRCGWLDLVALQYTAQINGLDSISFTKLDILSSFSELKVCTEYQYPEGVDPDRLGYFSEEILEDVTPEYQTFDGWKQDIRDCRSYEDLPEKAREYVSFVEQFLGVPIRRIGVGPAREEIITRDPEEINT